MLVEAARKQPGNNIEIFVVTGGQAAGIAFGLRDRASGRRKPARDFEFSGYLWLLRDKISESAKRALACGFALAQNKNPQAEARATGTDLRNYRDFHFAIAILHVLKHFGEIGERTSAFTKSLERISPRATLSNASRMKRGVWWNVDLMVISE